MDIAQYIKSSNAKREKEKKENLSAADAIQKYADYSEEQLMSELFRLGSLSSGKISEKELDDFFNKVKPYLSNGDRAHWGGFRESMLQFIKNRP